MGEKGNCKGGKGRGSKSLRSFVLRTHIVGGTGVRELHIDYWVKVVPTGSSFPGQGEGGCDYPNSDMCGGLLALILILLQTPFVHLVVKRIYIRDRRQLIKVGAATQSY